LPTGAQRPDTMVAGKRSNYSSQRALAFTLTDLVAVLAIVLILAVLQLPSAAGTRGKGQSASCLYNHRQLVRAWQLYAKENNGQLVGNLDGGDVMIMANSNKTWVLGWMTFTGGQPAGAATNTLYLSQYSPLAVYAQRDAAIFRCPADRSLSHGTSGRTRVRSISMNSYMGDRNRGFFPDAGSYSAGYWQFKKLSEVATPKPSQAFVFIDEREDSINDGWFAIDMGGFDPPQPSLNMMIDFPADWHNRGANLSFVDGHSETWRWQDGRTMPRHVLGQGLVLGQAISNSPDVARLQAAASSRVKR